MTSGRFLYISENAAEFIRKESEKFSSILLLILWGSVSTFSAFPVVTTSASNTALSVWEYSGKFLAVIRRIINLLSCSICGSDLMVGGFIVSTAGDLYAEASLDS